MRLIRVCLPYSTVQFMWAGDISVFTHESGECKAGAQSMQLKEWSSTMGPLTLILGKKTSNVLPIITIVKIKALQSHTRNHLTGQPPTNTQVFSLRAERRILKSYLHTHTHTHSLIYSISCLKHIFTRTITEQGHESACEWAWLSRREDQKPAPHGRWAGGPWPGTGLPGSRLL